MNSGHTNQGCSGCDVREELQPSWLFRQCTPFSLAAAGVLDVLVGEIPGQGDINYISLYVEGVPRELRFAGSAPTNLVSGNAQAKTAPARLIFTNGYIELYP